MLQVWSHTYILNKTRSVGVVGLWSMAVNARCAVRFTAWHRQSQVHPLLQCDTQRRQSHHPFRFFFLERVQAEMRYLPSRVGLRCQIHVMTPSLTSHKKDDMLPP